MGSNGKRCNSTWNLEIHHDGTAFAHGGDHSVKNLKLLCAAHNRLESERTFPHAKHFRKHINQKE
jgi:hypothetical protein